MKEFLYTVIPASLVLLIYWLSGGNFEREPELGVSVMISLWVGLAGFIFAKVWSDDFSPVRNFYHGAEKDTK